MTHQGALLLKSSHHRVDGEKTLRWGLVAECSSIEFPGSYVVPREFHLRGGEFYGQGELSSPFAFDAATHSNGDR